jgi:pyrroloquinoline quinone (PQQ) biosynthesis protein C
MTLAAAPATGFGDALEARRRALWPLVGYAWGRLLAGPAARRRLVDYLAEAYHYVRYSGPLMERAAAKLDGRRAWLAEYWRAHAIEEAGHDEMLLGDLERLGRPRAEVIAALPRRETLALVASQFYVIEELDPAALLGYAYALEGGGLSEDWVREVGAQLAIPMDSLRTLREHAGLDPGHARELRRVLDRCGDARERRLIEWNLTITLGYLSDLALAVATEDPGSV